MRMHCIIMHQLYACVMYNNYFPSARCKPKKCRQECKKSCPVVKIGEHGCTAAMGTPLLPVVCITAARMTGCASQVD